MEADYGVGRCPRGTGNACAHSHSEATHPSPSRRARFPQLSKPEADNGTEHARREENGSVFCQERLAIHAACLRSQREELPVGRRTSAISSITPDGVGCLPRTEQPGFGLSDVRRECFRITRRFCGTRTPGKKVPHLSSQGRNYGVLAGPQDRLRAGFGYANRKCGPARFREGATAVTISFEPDRAPGKSQKP